MVRCYGPYWSVVMDLIGLSIWFDGYWRATWVTAKLDKRKERSQELVATASSGLSLSRLPEEAFFEQK